MARRSIPRRPHRACTRASAFAVVLFAACAPGDDTAATHATVRDSAGVQIVEHPAPAVDAAAPFTVAAEPSLVLGGAGDVDDPLFRVRGARRLSDGGVVVANSGASQLRYYAVDGTPVRSVGSKGGGPGEFESLLWLDLLPGDTAITYDGANQRYTLFDAAGVVVRSFQPSTKVPPRPLGLLRGGAILAHMPGFAGGMPPTGLTMLRDTVRIVTVDHDGAVGDTLARVPGDERAVRASPQSIEILLPPFAPRLVVAAAGDGFWGLRDGGYALEYRGLDGRLQRIATLDLPGREATAEMLDAHVARLTADLPDEARRRSVGEGMRALPMPERIPVVGRLLTDRSGNVWAQDFVAPIDTVATWRVFDRAGRYLGAVPMPRDLTVYEIGDEYVLGLERDENDVEEVRLYALRR